ncbi:MAG: ABC transporter ATP-binding protein [Lachnospiraceae bacterium]
MKINSTLHTMSATLKTNKGITAALGIIIIAAVFTTLIPPQLMRILIDKHLLTGQYNGIPTLALLYVCVLLLIGVTDFIKGCLLTILGQRFILSLRSSMLDKLEHIGASYFSKNPTGFITSHFTTDVDHINALFSDGMISMLIDCLKIIGIIISIFLFSLPLGITTLCLVPILFFITRYFQHKMLQAQIDNLVQLGNVNTHISESIKNSTMIKLFCKESYMEDLYCNRLRDNFTTKQKVNFYDSCYAPIVQMIRAITIGGIVLLSAKQLNLLGISIGMVAASIDLMTNLLQPIESLGMELQNIQQGISGMKRLDSFFMEPEEIRKEETLTPEDILTDHMVTDIVFEHLTFHYDNNNSILEDINITIPGQSNVTFTGRTGIGKTTLFNLIMGLLQPSSGHILLNGIDTCRIPNSAKRKIFGYVEQNFQFITGTVAEQISLRDTSIHHAQIEAACVFVGLHDYIMNMPDGYETMVDRGEGFSWGQRQLLAIARAIVSNPPILLLDEITANLDSVTEENVVTVLKQAGLGRTILSISHRMASVLSEDQVIRLE